MLKSKKMVSLFLTMVMVLSFGAVGVLAEDGLETPIQDFHVSYEGNRTVITAIIAPGEILTEDGIIPVSTLAEERVWPEQSVTQSTALERDFTCNSSDGNRLNVWVRNNGTDLVIATLTTDNIAEVEPGIGGYTFGIRNPSGTYTLKVRDYRNKGYTFSVTTKARQFWQ